MRVLLSLLLLPCVAAAAPRILLVENSSTVARARVDQLERRLVEGFEASGFEVVRSTSAQAVEMEPNAVAVVTLSMSELLKAVTLDLEAVSVRTRAVLAQHSFRIKWGSETKPLTQQLAGFCASLNEMLTAESTAAEEARKVAAVDAPRALPLPQLPPPPVQVVARKERAVAGPLAVSGATVAVLVVAGVLALVANGQRSDLRQNARPLDAAQQQVAATNGLFTGSAVAAGIGGGLAVASVALWVRSTP